MGREDRLKVLRIALVSGALMIVGVGVYLILGGNAAGWVVLGFGVIDLLTVPLVARLITRGPFAAGGAISPVSLGDPVDEPDAQDEQSTPDPSYNPYARED